MADDFLNNPAEQGFPSELDTASPYTGNRPASGARRATPGEVLSQGFQGAQNAGDFLGLDTEFAGSQDPNLAYGSGSPLDLVPPPTIHDDANQGFDPSYAQGGGQAPAPLPEGDAVQEFAEAPSAFEFGEDLGSDEGEFAPLEEPTSSRKPLLIGALVFGALAAGGLFYGPTLYSSFFGSTSEVAQVPSATPAKPTRVEQTPFETSSPAPTPSVAAVEPSTEPLTSSSKSVSSAPDPAPTASSFKPARSVEPSTSLSEESTPSVAEGQSAEGESTLTTPGLPASTHASAFPNLAGAEYEWASADQLELIWRGTEVPLEAMKAPAKTVMPRVGQVRVFTTTGDVFDGRLYAVGQNRVWLDTEPGRVGLDGDKVERIEVLPALPEGTKTSGDPSLIAGAKRARVRVPGGMLYGKVLKVEGEDVTLALDQGGRVRVKASELEDLGPGRAIVVRR